MKKKKQDYLFILELYSYFYFYRLFRYNIIKNNTLYFTTNRTAPTLLPLVYHKHTFYYSRE